MNILCIHGIGHQEDRKDWREDWKHAIETSLPGWNPGDTVIEQFAYDDMYEAADSSGLVYLKALALLLKSWAGQWGERDLSGRLDWVRWHVGMVAQFVALPELRDSVAAKLAQHIQDFKPDVILAHSLGGLIAYHCLSSAKTRHQLGDFKGDLVTFGTQISHPALSDLFAGRISCPPMLRRWWNLYNENDLVLTRSIVINGDNRYSQIPTPFSFDTVNHDPDQYLTHTNARSSCWREMVQHPAVLAKAIETKGGVGRKMRAVTESPLPALTLRRPKQRALLVGIAEYAEPSYALQGPVNDVFLVSQTLQEMGLEADAIRVVLNERATAAAIRERLAWLLADTQADDTLFFYFSGHGAQVPAYGSDAEVDRIDECLVPYDFNWQTGNAIFDNEFAALYSQLPYSAKFVAVLDCCHAGGMQRGGMPSGGGQRGGVRAIAMPDDIRHRALRWDKRTQMWLPRTALLQGGRLLKKDLLAQEASKPEAGAKATLLAKVDARVGSDGTLRRIGRAQGLRGNDPAAYEARRSEFGNKGPYMPILLEACAEDQSAYEYQHGSVHYGAFTYALCESLDRGRGTRLSFDELLAATRQRVRLVANGPQIPQLVCATDHRHSPVLG